jgi:hypothetical protein
VDRGPWTVSDREPPGFGLNWTGPDRLQISKSNQSLRGQTWNALKEFNTQLLPAPVLSPTDSYTSSSPIHTMTSLSSPIATVVRSVSSRGGNRAGQVGFGFGSAGSGQGRVGPGRVGSIYMLCFFRSLIDFDWIKGHLISDRVEFGSGSGPGGFLGSDRVLSPLASGVGGRSIRLSGQSCRK